MSIMQVSVNGVGLVAHSLVKNKTADLKRGLFVHTEFYFLHIRFLLSVVSPRGDGPLPEVGAIPGQPVKETKQALCILPGTKI